MGPDREKTFLVAEKLLKSGKASAALVQIRQLATRFGDDLVFQNRIGDLLALNKLSEEAITYYERVAFTYRDSGFLPKAIAMFKKVLRLNPESYETMVSLGHLYLKQKLPGEARNYLLHAGEMFIKASSIDRALEVYQTLVDAEPTDFRHKVRLVETMAAGGDTTGAGEKLLEMAREDSGQSGTEREQIFRRCSELLPDRQEPIAMIAAAMVQSGQVEEALSLLDEEIGKRPEHDLLFQEKIRICLALNRGDEALGLLANSGPECSPEMFRVVLRRFHDDGKDAEFWERVDDWFQTGSDPNRQVALLTEAIGVEEPAHVPALKRLFELHDGAGRKKEAVRSLEFLIARLRGDGSDDELDPWLERLMELQPDSSLLEEATSTAPGPLPDVAPKPDSKSAPASDSSESAQPADPRDELRSEFPDLEAPAVPLNKSDEEFAMGRLTQAEILSKYGLEDKALVQVREVIQRFPGHVEAQTKLTQLLMSGGKTRDLRDAWIGLAFAERASGHMEAAERASSHAAQVFELDPETRRALGAFGLPGTDTEPIMEAEPARQTSDPVITKEEEDESEELFFVEDEPEAEPEVAAEPEEEVQVDEPPEEADDDLAALTAALEGELFLEEDEILVPEATREESLEDVFAAFQQQVDEQVATDDFQTHYDLGIAYKEMGLVDEAISEFAKAAVPGPFYREACIMIANCHRDLGRPPEAASWYKKALAEPYDDQDACSGLTYDLAEVLVDAGETNEALGLFRGILDLDPGFREVANRVSELESRSGS